MVKRHGQIVDEHGWNLISHSEEIIGTYCSVFVCRHRKILPGHNFFSFDTNHTCVRACWRKKRSSSFSGYTRSSQDVQIWKWTSSKNTQEPADMWPMGPVVKSRMWNCMWQQCESHGIYDIFQAYFMPPPPPGVSRVRRVQDARKKNLVTESFHLKNILHFSICLFLLLPPLKTKVGEGG